MLHRRSFLRLTGTAGLAAVALPVLGACAATDEGAGPTGPSGPPGSSPGGSTPAGLAPPATATPVVAGYGPLGPPDANGVRLPPGFTSRIVATTGSPVGPDGFVWHTDPDGGAVFATDDGGWIYVSNSESIPGGASMLRFDGDGQVVAARSILTGTVRNCAGGATPWRTWLSCEEVPTGRVWECDPTGGEPAVVRDALGVCSHEAAAADPDLEVVYLTEDEPEGGLYRFRPDRWGDLSAGRLEVLVAEGDTLRWVGLPDPAATATPLRQQVPGTRSFAGGEGADVVAGVLWFSSKGDNRLWRLEPVGDDGATLDVVWDGAAPIGDVAVADVDNVVVGPGDLPFIAEDGPGQHLVVVDGEGRMHPVAQVTDTPGSEITGPAFSPDGTRLYFSSQRSPGRTYEVRGPFLA